jgi:hypothetical protein
VTLPTNNIVHPTKTVRWLGIWLDDKFSFKEHIKIKTTAATRAYYAFKSLATSQNCQTPLTTADVFLK